MATDTSKHPNGIIEVQLDRPRKLKWTNNVLCEFEAALGVSLFEHSNPLSLGVRAFREALYQMLRREDSTITRDQCGDFLDEYDKQGEVTRAIVRAWRVANGLTADPTPEEQQAAAAATPEAAPKNA
jgi:hypothetical protein